MNSIISYPDRGPYGNNSYRGNCSGFVIKDLIEHFRPKSFLDVTEGSGTSKQVCSEFNVNYKGLDLNNGFDLTSMSILKTIGNPFEMVFSHLPYHDMVDYNSERKKHHISTKFNPSDLSACKTVDEFLEKSQFVLLNQREASNNIYTTLIGDYRKNGLFYSFQADFIAMMPKSELLSVVIKQQYNHQSHFKNYNGNFIPITHEYLIIWKKKTASIYQVAIDKAFEFKKAINNTWKNIVHLALLNLDGQADLNSIYKEVLHIAGDKAKNNPHYKAKIRQTLQKYAISYQRGIWKINT